MYVNVYLFSTTANRLTAFFIQTQPKTEYLTTRALSETFGNVVRHARGRCFLILFRRPAENAHRKCLAAMCLNSRPQRFFFPPRQMVSSVQDELFVRLTLLNFDSGMVRHSIPSQFMLWLNHQLPLKVRIEFNLLFQSKKLQYMCRHVACSCTLHTYPAHTRAGVRVYTFKYNAHSTGPRSA